MGLVVILGCLIILVPQAAHTQYVNFEYLGSTLPDDNLLGFSVAGDYAYIAGQHMGMFVVDISNPNNPLALGSFDTPGLAWDVYVDGNYAYLADGTSGLQIFNISNPVSPDLIGSYDTPGISEAVSVIGNYAYMADGSSGLQIIDISNPTSPILAFSCDTLVNLMDIFILDNYAYLADRGLGLLIYNIDIPDSPVFVGSFYDDDYCGFDHIFAAGNYAYLVPQCIVAELMIFDITDPTNPVLVSSDNPTTVSAYDIYVDNNYVFLNLTNGLLVYDVSDPYNPVIIGDYQTPNTIYSTHAYGNLLYMSGWVGFWICSFSVLAGCDYAVGDANNSGDFNGLDITFGVSYFKGGPTPPYECECTAGNTWYVAGDVNGSCNYNGLDITYGVAYFKGGPAPIPCPDCPPN
jgi:hypothetical protein